jgi:hypothetical protein
MGSSQVAMFFVELFNRLKSKSPKFFLVLQVIFASLTFAGYVPVMLERYANISVSQNLINLCEDIAKYTTGFLIAVLLPSKPTPVAQTEEGKAIIVTDEKKLPFTAKDEKKSVDETKPPPPVAEEIPEQPKD